ncbi:TetR family transcriptional regulator [Couchioplanes caeruleus]|uniref:TetR family transcriptional regulator n=2 Tax=Couchioplanes caeruleus TaxID=56438 RepID=A0A1K0FEE2_9ACTN|nr:TetR family transcriptional regulator [Couchioplanes caeruleus]OJF11207.1 TetR family transcriptional regulator [Couchioplanes caeruleus subsp. caeruleus]OJF15989.1 TetR family transcriptional regulator [Couchioplanes caeruleus subsp. caeruleus]ROP27845.1 TetR family transcriptional regulator [Couchioplanes caeruleus]
MSADDETVNSADGRSKRWAHHRERRREELIDAVIAAIRELGPEPGIDAVAAHAGVSKPVLYRYFTDKSGVWEAVARRAAAAVVEAVAPAVAAVGEDREVVTAAVDAYLAFIENDPHLYRFVVHQRGIARERDVVADAIDTVASVLARILGDRLRALGLDSGGALPWAYGIVGYVQTVGDWWLRHQQPISREALAEYLTTLLWGGMEGVRSAADTPGGLAAKL